MKHFISFYSSKRIAWWSFTHSETDQKNFNNQLLPSTLILREFLASKSRHMKRKSTKRGLEETISKVWKSLQTLKKYHKNTLPKKENRILRNMGRPFPTFANILLDLQNSYEDARISKNKKGNFISSSNDPRFSNLSSRNFPISKYPKMN